MLFYLILLVAAVSIVWSLVQGRSNQRRVAQNQRLQIEEALVTSRRAAEEDVTKFGEELQRLDTDVAGHALDDGMRQDYQHALDAYEAAKTSLAAVKAPDEIRNVTRILEEGRYAVACVNARIEGKPLPEKRPPCFFNPAHGPSTQNVRWTPPGGTERDVPACAADAERVLAGADPYIRTVQVGSQRVPYWEGGAAYAPWAQGYYTGWSGSSMIRDMMIGSMIFNTMPYVVGGMMGGFGGGWGGGYGGGWGDGGYVGDGGFGGGIGDGGLGGGLDQIGQGMGDVFGGLGNGIDQIGDGIGDAFNDIGNFFDF